MGTGPTGTLPVTAVSVGAGTVYGPVMINDPGVAQYAGSLQPSTTTIVLFYLHGTAGTYANIANITSTAPMTWATGDILSAIAIYEAA